MSTCPCVRCDISMSHDDISGADQAEKLQRLAGGNFGMHITVAMGTARVRSLYLCPSAPLRPRTWALIAHRRSAL
jgi:hypothetical protein